MKIMSWANIRLVLMFGTIAFLYSFASHRSGERKIRKTEVVFEDKNSFFLTGQSVNKLLIEKNNDLKTVSKHELDLNVVEKSVNRHRLVKNAECYVSVDGVLKVKVKQKEPLARFFGDSGSFYIDSEGAMMPLSTNCSVRVPLISGEIGNVQKSRLSEVLKAIAKDEFLKKNVIGIQVLPKGDLVMANRNYNYRIDFGKIVNVQGKFKNYKAFFQKAVQDSTLDKYRIVNLKFAKQVVCVK